MSQYTLYTENTWRSSALQAVARYAGLYVNYNNTVNEVELKALSPTNSLPLLVTDIGGLSQTTAIARFLALQSQNHPLYGESAFESAQIDAWLDWVSEKVLAPSRVLLPIETMLAADYYVVKKTVELLGDDLVLLNNHVSANTFLVGRFLSVADIYVAFALAPLFTQVLGKTHVKNVGGLTRWLATILGQPGVAPYYGTFTLLNNSPIPNNPPKKAAKPAGGAHDDDDEHKDEIVPDVLYLGDIVTTMNLEAWKVKYANTNPTKPEATNWFWENYDPAGYSLFIFHYKFFQECTVDYKTNNLFGGFAQRADGIKGMSRVSCASVCVLQKDERFHIWGVWMFKGDDIPAPFAANVDDVNYYDWEKVDPSSPEQKALVSDFWAQESDNEFGGRGTFVSARSYGV